VRKWIFVVFLEGEKKIVNHYIGRAYGTGGWDCGSFYPGVKTTGLQYISCLRHSFVLALDTSSGGTNDIVAMEFIPLQKKDVIVTKEF